MKNSIRTKITLMVVLFSTVIIVASWVTCTFLIKGVFVAHVEKSLKITYESCNDIFCNPMVEGYKEGDLYNNVDNPISAMVLVLDVRNERIYTSINDDGQMMDSLERIIDSIRTKGDNMYHKPGTYVIDKNYDSVINAYYYDLVGTLDNGNIIILRAPITQIEETMKVVSRVFMFVAIALIIFGSVFILAFSSIFSVPIKNLSHVAKRMTQLDFEVKVTIYTKDEIGELGRSMNEMSEKLESTISELKTANVKLEKDIQEKQQIDDMRKEFLSHVSHELKTPIALIQGYAEGLKDNLFDDEESKDFYTDVIIDEAQKMNHLVKKLLNLNEIEFGQTPISIERFELTGFIDDIVEAHSILLDENTKILFEEDKPCYVWADEYLIEDVVTNYLTNAIHYVKQGGLIKIFFETVGKDLRVCVYNQGDNIPDEDIDKIFIKFYKVDKARTREYGGNGIGLSIVAATMEAHGKKYGVYNVEDGVVFYFDLDANMP